MSYDLEILPRANEDNENAELSLRAILSKMEHCTVTESQFWFDNPDVDEGPLGAFASTIEDDGAFTEDDEEPIEDSFAWLSINYFRTREYYKFCGEIINTIININGFKMYDPQSEKILEKPLNINLVISELDDANEFIREIEKHDTFISKVRRFFKI